MPGADGASTATFPTVKSPNPENPEGFYLAVDLAKEVGSDLIIGTDPDSDRVGTMVRGTDGEYRTITGNQMGVLLLDYIITARRRKRHACRKTRLRSRRSSRTNMVTRASAM